MAANPNWEALSVQVPGQDLLEGARNAMETLVVYLEVVKTILETVKIFLIDFGNPIKPLVEALLQLILDLFDSLRKTGLYGWYDVPDPLRDPNFNRFVGGFPAFTTRFKAGLIDPRDPNRPQPISGVSQGGFMLIVADAESPLALLRFMQVLLRFFGKEFTTPQYPAPANFKVLPVGRAGDPILALARLFQEQPDSIAVEWSLPPVASPGDPGFSDLIQAFSQNFFPPRFLIEKSAVNPAVGEVNVEDLSNADATGVVVMDQEVEFRNRGVGTRLKRKKRMIDNYGDPFLKFQQYIVIDASTNSSTFLLGQLGTFRYIDSDVEPNKTYFYRVRAYSGSLNVVGTSVTPVLKTNPIDKIPYLEWPGTDTSDPPVMGKASPTIPMIIPTYPANFDVIENLRRLFQTAFSLNFHLPLPKDAKFTSNGDPIDPTVNSDVGKGSLQSLAGPLTSFAALPLVGDAVSNTFAVTAQFQRNEASGEYPEFPWNYSQVRRNASRLANIVASAMLQANSAVAFKALMEGPFTKGTPETPGLGSTVSSMVFKITEVQDPDEVSQAAVQDAGVLYGDVFTDLAVRKNVLAAVEFCKAFTLIGSPPNWTQISILRDIAPWSGQIIYDLLAKMQALLDAYAGVVTELNAFIDLIVQKVDTLERFLEYLISILDFVESLSLGFYVLSVPQTDGDVNTWMSLIDNAGGTPPPSGPGGYTGGIAMAYVAPDVASFAAAMKLIF